MTDFCRVLNDVDKAMAKELDFNEEYYRRALSLYSSIKNDPNIQPSKEEISKFIQEQEEIAKAEKTLIGQNIKGENISSKGSEFAKRLTNPFNKETVEFRGTKFDNAEHAYQTWKSGKFDQKGYDAHGSKIKGTTDYNTNYQTMVEIITAKLQQHPDLVQGIDERGGLAYLNNSTHNVIGDEFWEKQGNFMKALKEAYNKVKDTSNKLTQDQVLTRLNEYQAWTKDHVKFVKDDHTYYVDGKKVDYSVTQLEDIELKRSKPDGDYAFTQAIGTAVDSLTRDFFLGNVNIREKEYPNLNETRKDDILKSLIKLQGYFDKRFGVDSKGKPLYKVITNEFALTGKIKSSKIGEATVAGTMDMLVIDSDGNAHIFDMKAKNRKTWEHINKHGDKVDYGDKAAYTFQLNTYQKLLEGIIPGLKVASKQLIWFNQEYPKQFVEGRGGDAKYLTDKETDEVIVTDLTVKPEQRLPLSDFDKWKTPILKTKDNNGDILDDESEEASIKKIETAESSIYEVAPIDPKWSPTQNYNQNTQSQMEVEKPNWDKVTKKAKGETKITEKSEEAPVIPSNEMVVKSSPKADYINNVDSTQRTYRAEWLAHQFSSIVSEELEKLIQEATTNKDLGLLNILNDSDKGRKYVIGRLSPAAILERIKTSVQNSIKYYSDKENPTDTDTYVAKQWKNVLEYWNFIVDDSLAIIEGSESLRFISFNTIKYNGDSTTGASTETTDDELEKTEDETNDDEEGARNTNGNEGWGYKYREVDPITTLSKTVKNILGNLFMRGEDGNIAVDDIGNNRYLNQEWAHAVLISELSSCKTPDDFVTKVDEDDDDYDFIDENNQAWKLTALREVATKYSWANDIISKISEAGEEEGKEVNSMRLVSMFYTDFRKDFIPYWKQYYDANDGKWKTLRLNQKTAVQSTLNNAINNYEQGRKLEADSVYGNVSSGGLSKENAKKGIVSEETIKTFKNVRDAVATTQEELDKATKELAKALRMIGFEVVNHTIANALKVEDGATKMIDCCGHVNHILQGIISDKDNKITHLVSAFDEQYSKISDCIGLVAELENMGSFRSGDKTFYSYSAPNYLDSLFDNLFKIPANDKEEADKEDFLQNQFGKYSWFKDQKTDEWRSLWLEEIAQGSYLDRAELKELNTISISSEKGKPKNYYYTDWTPTLIKTAFIREYYSVQNSDKNEPMAYYHFPIFANSPVAKFVKFRRYNINNPKDYNTLLRGFRQVVEQEIDRITLVKNRKTAGAREIGNFDKAGEKFCFFPVLNNVDGGSFYDNCLKLKGDKDKLDSYINDTIKKILEAGFKESLNKNIDKDTEKDLTQYLRSNGVLDANSTHEDYENAIRDYYFNQAFASTQIIQLCTTDIAYYKNGTDFQKRFKELYAAGVKLNTNAKYGKEFESTVYLKDCIVTSPSYMDIKDALDAAVKAGKINKFDKAIILNKFKNVNVADAQAYRSIKSMRAVLDMLGKWNDSMEAALERFKNGEWKMADFELVWQTIKPFVYTQIEKPDGLGGFIKVPHQNKNSEFLILALYNIIRSPINKSPMMRALDRFMQENDIDVIQFESAVKAGNQGTINLSYSNKKLEDWFNDNNSERNILIDDEEYTIVEAIKKVTKSNKENYGVFKEGLDTLLNSGIILQEEYNRYIQEVRMDEKEVLKTLNNLTKEVEYNEDGTPKKDKDDNFIFKRDENNNSVFIKEVVHKIPYKDYCIQQPTPEHLIDHEAVYGSQFRNLIISDLPDDFEVTIKGKKYDKKEIKYLYQSLIVSNLIKDYKRVVGKFATIEELQKALLQTVKGNTRYSRDLEEALQIVEVNGEKVFNIPLDNPSTTDKIQELTNSMFKSAIQKQKIKGGACIMVSNFGLLDNLHVVFNKTEKIIDEDGEEKIVGIKTSGIKGIECYLPASSRQHYEPFMKTSSYTDEKGETHEYQYLDVKELHKAGLDKLIGYRIPTEDKYSMANLIVKGFLPQQNGSAIMLPSEITQIAGSDFDVDKMFLMIPEFTVKNEYDLRGAWEEFYNEHPEIKDEIENKKYSVACAVLDDMIAQGLDAEKYDIEDKKTQRFLVEQAIKSGAVTAEGGNVTVEEFRDYYFSKQARPEFAKWFKENKERFFIRKKVEKIEANIDNSPLDMTREERNNLLIDISYAILSHPDTGTKVLNPGSFDKMKIAARIATISNDEILSKKFWVSQKYGKEVLPIDKDINKEYNAEELADMILKVSKEQDLDTLDNFLKKEKRELDPLSVDTFIYYHVQNMTGDALIGMYALNTTMQGKYQNTELRLKEENYFMLNGRRIDSLHDTFTKDSKRGKGERISKICANGSAASVDNVKDPVLADLMQNMKTANVCGFMMRAGMTLEEIGLFFSQPLIREIVQSEGSLSKLEDYETHLIDTLGALQGDYRRENILMRDFSSKELLMNILNQPEVEKIKKLLVKGHLVDDNKIVAEDGTEVSIDAQKLRKMIAQQIEAIEYMIHIRDCAEDLSEATRISRADSPNGAIFRNIAGARNQIQKVANYKVKSNRDDFHLTNTTGVPVNDYLKPGMSEEQMLDSFMKSPMPMLQAFYSLGIDYGLKAMKDYYVYTTDEVETYTKHLFDNTATGTLTDENIRLFYQDLIEYALTKSSLIGGNDFENKRDYYLYDYPYQFLKVVQDNPEIASLKIIKKLLVQNGEIIFENAGKTTPKMREAFMRDLDTLLYMDTKDNAAQKLAEDLFMYAYYKNGFKFGPKNYGMYFSTNFITSFPNFTDTLRNIKNLVKERGFMLNYLKQFYANHKEFVPTIKKNKAGNNVFENEDNLAVNTAFVRNTKVSADSIYPYIVYNEKLYELDSKGDNYVYYTPMPTFTEQQKGPRGVKYNANMSLEELALIMPDPKRFDNSAKANISTNSNFFLKAMAAANESPDNEGITSSIGEKAEGDNLLNIIVGKAKENANKEKNNFMDINPENPQEVCKGE